MESRGSRIRLPAATRKEALDLAISHSQPHIRDLFERFIPNDQRPQRLGNLVSPTQILSLAGDVSRGARLFAATEGIQCKSCHQINKAGTAVGPDLSHVGKQLTRSSDPAEHPKTVRDDKSQVRYLPGRDQPGAYRHRPARREDRSNASRPSWCP